jgi:hypothetical protein
VPIPSHQIIRLYPPVLVFWVMTPCSDVLWYHCYWGPCCLCHFTLKMEATRSSETLVSYHIIYTTSQPRRPRLQYLSEWKGQVSLPIYPFPRGPLFKYILRIRFSSFLSTWFHHCCVKCVAISLTYKDKETPTLVSIWYSTKTGNAKCTCGVMKQTLPREFLALDHVHALNLSGVSDGCRRTIDG